MEDKINSIFELLAGLFLWINVYRMYKDKDVKGVAIMPTLVFTLWGYWNLYFYPSVGCWYSFIAGIMLVTANTIWVSQMIYYSRR